MLIIQMHAMSPLLHEWGVHVAPVPLFRRPWLTGLITRNISNLEVSLNGVKRHVCFVVMETAGERDVSVVKVAGDWSTVDVLL